MPKIRQEINLLNYIFLSDTSLNWRGWSVVHVDTSVYNGETYYVEIVAVNTDSSARAVYIYEYADTGFTGGSPLATINVPANTNSWTRIRSTSISPSDPYFDIALAGTPSADDLQVKSAKIIILQDATDITDTQTQIEVGAYESKLSAAVGNTWYPLDEPKYWKYESAKWDPTPTFTFAVSYAIENDSATIDYGIQEDDAAGGWTTTPIATITGLTSEVADYQESASFTPTNGKIHRLVWRTSGTMYGTDTFNAKIIATQTEELNDIDSNDQGTHNKLFFDGTFVFNALESGLACYQVASDGTITLKDTDQQGTNAYNDVWGDGSYIYCATDDGLMSYTVDGSGNLTWKDTDKSGSYDYLSVWGDGSYIYTGAGFGDIHTYTVDGSGILTRQYTNTQGANNLVKALVGDGTFLFSATLGSGVQSFSISSGELTYVDVDDQGNAAYDVLLDSNYLYLANDIGGIEAYTVDGSGYFTNIINGGERSQGLALIQDGVLVSGTVSNGIQIVEFNGSSFSVRTSDTDFDVTSIAKSFSTEGLIFTSASTSGFVVYEHKIITKFQPEYLLINEAQTDTGLQEFPTYFDPDEWDGVSNVYWHEHTADSAGSNTKLIHPADSETKILDKTGGTSVTDNIFGSGGNYEAYGQGFTSLDDFYLTKVVLRGLKYGSPTDNLDLDFLEGDPDTGTVIASKSIAASGIGGTEEDIVFTFSEPVIIKSGVTEYSWRCLRSGSRDISNYIRIFASSTAGIDGGGYDLTSGSWSGPYATDDKKTELWGYDTTDITNSDITGDDLVRTGLTYININDQGGNYWGVWSDGTYIYTASGTSGLMAYSFNGTTLTHIYTDFQSGNYYGVWGDGTYIYTASGTSGLMAYSFNGTTLTHIDTDFQDGSYYGVWGDGTYIYTATYGSGLMAYSFNGTTLTHIDTDFQSGNYWAVWGDGTYIYVVTETSGLMAYSFNGTTLTHINTNDQGGTYYDVWSDGTYIYTASGTSGLMAYSFNGTTLTHIDTDFQSGDYLGVRGDGTYIYVATATSGLMVYSFNGTTLTHIDTDFQSGYYRGVWIDGTYIYTASGTSGLMAYIFAPLTMPTTAKEIDAYIVTA